MINLTPSGKKCNLIQETWEALKIHLHSLAFDKGL